MLQENGTYVECGTYRLLESTKLALWDPHGVNVLEKPEGLAKEEAGANGNDLRDCEGLIRLGHDTPREKKTNIKALGRDAVRRETEDIKREGTDYW